MIRFLIRTLVFLASCGVGLIAAAWILPDMSIGRGSFVTVVVIFAILQSLLSPFLARSTARNAPAILSAVGLLSTFVALLITHIFVSGLVINGAATWLFGTLIVWLVTMLATMLLPFILVKSGVEAARDRKLIA